MLVSHAGIGLHIHIIHDFYLFFEWTSYDLLFLSEKWDRWIVMKPTDTRDIPRHPETAISWMTGVTWAFFGIVRSYHATRHTLYHAISQWYPNDITMFSASWFPASWGCLAYIIFIFAGESPSCPWMNFQFLQVCLFVLPVFTASSSLDIYRVMNHFVWTRFHAHPMWEWFKILYTPQNSLRFIKFNNLNLDKYIKSIIINQYKSINISINQHKS